MNEEEIRILTPLLGETEARRCMALATLASSCAQLAQQVRALQETSGPAPQEGKIP